MHTLFRGIQRRYDNFLKSKNDIKIEKKNQKPINARATYNPNKLAYKHLKESADKFGVHTLLFSVMTYTFIGDSYS